jgi:uncharacterized protein (TIRG00374 family)
VTDAGAEPLEAGDAAGLPTDRPRGIFGRILSGVLSYGVVILIMWFTVEKLTTPEEAESGIAAITAAQVVVICVLGVVNLATNLPPILVTLPTLRFREAAVTNTASAALSNTVPEGGAVATGLNFAMLRSWGFRLTDITSSFLVTGTWTNFVRYGLMALALVVLVAEGDASAALLWVTVIVVVLVVAALIVFALILRSERFATDLGGWVDRLMRKAGRLLSHWTLPVMEVQVPRFRTEMIAMVRYSWHWLTVWMTVSQLTACVVLAVALRMQGLDQDTIPFAKVVVAYGATALASLIAPTPGGLGVAEATLLAVLGAGLDDSLNGQILAGILLYRIATWLLPIPIGAASYLYWRHSQTWRKTEAERYGVAQPA